MDRNEARDRDRDGTQGKDLLSLRREGRGSDPCTEGKLEEGQQRLVVPVERRQLSERQIPGY